MPRPTVQTNGLRLDHRLGALTGGKSGSPALVPGHSAESRLVAYVAGLDPEVVMPPTGQRLTEEQIALLRAWIDQGAHYSEEESGTLNQKHQASSNHWSFRPIVRPTVPIVKNASGFAIRSMPLFWKNWKRVAGSHLLRQSLKPLCAACISILLVCLLPWRSETLF